jgi:hypothetical protein
MPANHWCVVCWKLVLQLAAAAPCQLARIMLCCLLLLLLLVASWQWLKLAPAA